MAKTSTPKGNSDNPTSTRPEGRANSPAPDWTDIELAFIAGKQSVRKIAAQHGITHGAINKRAKANGWVRFIPSKQIASIPDNGIQPVTSDEVSTLVSTPAPIGRALQGRPSAYTDELGEAICSAIADGMSLRSVLACPGMPSKSMVMRWLANDDYIAFRDQYAHAREAQADKLAEEILQIADDGSNDTYLDAKGNIKVDHDVIARSRLQVDARKWLASKMAPKKYGDRLLQEVSGVNNTAIQVHSTVTFVRPPKWDDDGRVIDGEQA